MITAEHVAELVLVPEPLVPVGVEKEMFGARARPPRLLEVVIEVGVAADECRANAGANRIHLTWRERTRRIRRANHRIAIRSQLDAVGDDDGVDVRALDRKRARYRILRKRCRTNDR